MYFDHYMRVAVYKQVKKVKLGYIIVRSKAWLKA